MKKLAIYLIALVAILAAFAFRPSTSSAYPDYGGYSGAFHGTSADAWVLEDGGTITIKSGGTLQIDSGAIVSISSSVTSTYLIDQDVRTTDDVEFNALTLTEGVDAVSATFTGGVSAVTASFSGAITAATLNTGQGASELYLMDQNVRTTDSPTFSYATITNGISGVTATFSGALAAATVNTGQGAAELYLMDENVRSTDSPTWANITVTSNITVGGDIGFDNISVQEVVQVTPTVAGKARFCTDCAPARPIWSIVGGWIYATGLTAP